MAEFSLLVSIYRQFPDLASKSVDPGDNAEDKGVGRAVVSSIMVFFRGWRHYFQHKVWPAGLGLAMLYMTVLGFDSTLSPGATHSCRSDSHCRSSNRILT